MTKVKIKAELLDQIRADILAQNICPNLAKTAKQLVFGDGNPDAEVVFIGEAPGKNEDEEGEPFVGAAGKFLNEMLNSVNLNRSDMYITNIVKYRPPANRDPLPEEKKAFLGFLQAQLAVIQPKLVVTLGRHSMDSLLPGQQISQIHGQPKRTRAHLSNYAIHFMRTGSQDADAMQGSDEKQTEPYRSTVKGVSQSLIQQRAANDSGVGSSAGEQAIMTLVVLPLYHPAAALYNGGMRQTLLEDFALIPRIINQINQESQH